MRLLCVSISVTCQKDHVLRDCLCCKAQYDGHDRRRVSTCPYVSVLKLEIGLFAAGQMRIRIGTVLSEQLGNAVAAISH